MNISTPVNLKNCLQGMSYLGLVFTFLLTACTEPKADAEPEKIPVRVVVVSMFESGEDAGDRPGEMQYWVERLPLPDSFPFPQGYRQLRYNADLQVLSVMTGIGNTKSGCFYHGFGLGPSPLT